MNEVKGQIIPKQILSSIIKTGNYPSSFLFYGPPGVGKFSTALNFASEILKDDKRIYKGTHPDLSIVFPEFEGYEKNELINMRKNMEYFTVRRNKGTISIDTVRKLQDYVYITPMENTWRIVIIVQSERITKEGFNAFLKILEEPPNNVIFILVTSEKNFLPDTIISRSQIIKFTPLSQEIQQQILKNKVMSRFGRGIEETLFMNSQKSLERKIEELFFNTPVKSRIKNWSEGLKKDLKIEFLLQYLQKSIEEKYKNKEIHYTKTWNSFKYLKNAYRYYYSNIAPEKIIFYLLLKV